MEEMTWKKGKCRSPVTHGSEMVAAYIPFPSCFQSKLVRGTPPEIQASAPLAAAMLNPLSSAVNVSVSLRK